MRKIAILLILLTGGCATGAQQESGRIQATLADGRELTATCTARLEQSPPYQALKDKMVPLDGSAVNLSLQVNPAKATPEEVRDIYDLHQNYIMPCRKTALETASLISPALVSARAASYAAYDRLYVQLAATQISWGEFNRDFAAERVTTQARVRMAATQIEGDLKQAHTAEVQQRRMAADAFEQWAYQQQALNQQQQLVDRAYQPRITTCNYIGVTLSCTTH